MADCRLTAAVLRSRRRRHQWAADGMGSSWKARHHGRRVAIAVTPLRSPVPVRAAEPSCRCGRPNSPAHNAHESARRQATRRSRSPLALTRFCRRGRAWSGKILAAKVAWFGSQHRWHFSRHDLQASGAAPASSGGGITLSDVERQGERARSRRSDQLSRSRLPWFRA
jgi:hypothetical protein